MTIGRWEEIPYYFTGIIDEVALYRGARHPSSINVPHLSLFCDSVNFGKIRVGDSISTVVQLSNLGFQDTLRITEIHVLPPFSCNPGTPLLIAPRSSLSLTLKYLPSAAGHDTLSFLMATTTLRDLPLLYACRELAST